MKDRKTFRRQLPDNGNECFELVRKQNQKSEDGIRESLQSQRTFRHGARKSRETRPLRRGSLGAEASVVRDKQSLAKRGADERDFVDCSDPQEDKGDS